MCWSVRRHRPLPSAPASAVPRRGRAGRVFSGRCSPTSFPIRTTGTSCALGGPEAILHPGHRGRTGALQSAPAHTLCKVKWLYYRGDENYGLGNVLYDVASAAALAIALNRTLIYGANEADRKFGTLLTWPGLLHMQAADELRRRARCGTGTLMPQRRILLAPDKCTLHRTWRKEKAGKVRCFKRLLGVDWLRRRALRGAGGARQQRGQRAAQADAERRRGRALAECVEAPRLEQRRQVQVVRFAHVRDGGLARRKRRAAEDATDRYRRRRHPALRSCSSAGLGRRAAPPRARPAHGKSLGSYSRQDSGTITVQQYSTMYNKHPWCGESQFLWEIAKLPHRAMTEFQYTSSI